MSLDREELEYIAASLERAAKVCWRWAKGDNPDEEGFGYEQNLEMVQRLSRSAVELRNYLEGDENEYFIMAKVTHKTAEPLYFDDE